MSPPPSAKRHVSDRDTTVLRRVDSDVASEPPLSVILFFPSELAQCHGLGEELSIGRDDACTITLTDGAISRRHAVLRGDSGTVTVEDLGSRNGTFVNGRRVRRAELAAGDTIRLGNALLVLVRLRDQWRPTAADGPLVGGVSLDPIRRQISLVGPSDLPVLVTGETGTGKELVARALHSPDRPGPFVAINCAALPEGLAESELFGHARGAFSGAQKARKGLFTVASGGTLFLDEIGEIPAALQPKLLRVLEHGVVRPIGSDVDHTVDVRIVSATNRDLAREVDEGRFRTDLFARLAGVEIKLLPLRSRIDDLPCLARYLLSRRGNDASCDADAMEALALCAWAQNVRQLDNALQSAALSATGTLQLCDLPDTVRLHWEQARRAGVGPGATPEPPKKDIEESLRDALRQTGGNVRLAAVQLSMARGHMYRLMKRWQIDPNDYRTGTGIATAPGRV